MKRYYEFIKIKSNNFIISFQLSKIITKNIINCPLKKSKNITVSKKTKKYK